MPKLITYKASAGSGKTYTLTKKYLELLFRDPFAYRSILAVTFTNKAAGEMKGRIMRELFFLSNGKDQKGKKPSFMDEICEAHNILPEEVSKRAAKILDNILNDYSRFSVGTIDKFFQMIIRSFTRETGLQASYNLELNNQKVLNEAVDNLIYEMDENMILREWMIQYAEDIIREGKSLNLKKEITNLGSEIFKESFMSLYRQYDPEVISDLKIREYSKLVNKAIFPFENKIAQIGKAFLETVNKYGLGLNDFKGASRSFVHYFKRIINPVKADSFLLTDTAIKAINNPSAWFVEKSDKKDKILQAFNGGLNKLLKEANDYVDRHYREYATAFAINKFIYAFGILSDLSRHVRQITLERNLFLLSDSSQFLNEIIAGNDAPFVYEKAGNYYKNFMLDEFQDTSVYQWGNFKPLIQNSLAEGFDNLVVGDVKQSIYRWRNSDWNILASAVQRSFPTYSTDVPLRENYRSRENIIRFNNKVFSESADVLQEKFLKGFGDENNVPEESNQLANNIFSAYRDSAQTVPVKSKGTGGFVSLRFLTPSLKNDDVEMEMKKRLPALILELQDRGYHAKDIAILVRYGKEGKQVASILLEYKNNTLTNPEKYNFNVISNDSLYVYNNAAVQMLAALLKHLVNRSDSINEAFIKHEYSRYLLSGRELPENYHAIFDKTLQQYSITFTQIYSNFITEYNNILQLSLFELVEKLILIFRLNENIQDLPYIQAFQDLVLMFMKNESSDISSFIEYWDEMGVKETLNISEQQDAIKIMTIHKAKGLEFKIVILPFCDWHIDHEAGNMINVLWCKTNIKPFDFLPFVPVNYSAGLAKTFFYNEYQNERLHAYIDNLNLLYVAMTRAIDELHVFSSPSKEENKNFPVHIGDLLLNVVEKEKIAISNPDEIELKKVSIDTDHCYEYGSPDRLITLKDKLSDTDKFDYYPVKSLPKNLRLRYRGEDYFSQEPEKLGSIDYGIVMHEILSRVKKKDDLEKSVEIAYWEGKIDPLSKGEIMNAFNTGFSKSIPVEIFQPGWKIFTERDILTTDGEYRPDRVLLKENSAIIIDYKFGIEIRRSHISQVQQYIKRVRETGYSNVKGYVWYFTLGKVEEVRDE